MTIRKGIKQLDPAGDQVTGALSYCGQDSISWDSTGLRHLVPLKTNAGAKAICVPIAPVPTPSEEWNDVTTDAYWSCLRKMNVDGSGVQSALSYDPTNGWEAYSQFFRWDFTPVGTWANGFRPSKMRLKLSKYIGMVKLKDGGGNLIGELEDLTDKDWYCADNPPYTAEFDLTWGGSDIDHMEVYNWDGGSYDSIYASVCAIELYGPELP